ncbi:hypothetical protein GA0070606_2663 [Micromonospora citrea]|uniref:Outer membrane channel protein CpnT-like N-terminal domain-containing protein n=1 Tax=Micromonospora citrea TaxID=47855 RepID=A0A1C6US34_9ACTN|nr:hypothetical protein [Micromonospora citrea]SCL56791.1 hypothetical protein GA0070606_2663 [Micromonospora citrea]
MSDKYYGWTPPYIPSYAGVVDDYAAERSAQAEPYEPTNWDGVTIEQMWEYARKESDERTVALAETWRRTSSLLQTTRENLKRHADALDAKWRSPAGRVFMEKVGAALHSLDEWKSVADKSASGLEQLADKIEKTQRDMRELWLEYKAEQEHQAKKAKDDEGVQFGDLFGINNAKSYEDVQKEFHERAKNIVKPLADLYIDVYISNITRGGMYKGPTNAVVHTPSLAPRPTRPGAPAGPKPVAPTMSGDRPTRPDMPNRPDTPDTPTTPTPPPPPGLPDGVRLAGTTITPPAPPGPPPAPPPVTHAPGTPPPPTPVLPVTGGQGTPRPNAPNINSRPGTPRTTLPGAGAPTPGTRGPAPNRPTLPGAGNPGGNPASRGAPPNRPTLPGNTGTGRPGGLRSGAPGLGTRPTGPATPPSTPRLPGSTAGPRHAGGTPGRPASPPPSLGGQRGTGPATPATSGPRAGSPTAGRPGTPPSAARPATPSVGGTRAGGPPTPGAGARPDLSGRGAGGAPRPAPTTGPAPSLGGRRGGPAVPGSRSAARPAEDEPETWEYGEGDDELWTTEPVAVGNIEAPAEHRPQQQGKALGQG